MSTNKPLADRFWEKVDRSGECWTWTASRFSNGYGRFNYTGDTRALGAHRYSYMLNVGPIPPGLVVRHRRDNPPCVRPDHLQLGTPVDNTRDIFSRGRRHDTRGTKNGQTILTEDAVREIRRIYAAGGTSFARVARRFEVTTMTAYHIVHRITWAHVA